jgi:hypothetical protein
MTEQMIAPIVYDGSPPRIPKYAAVSNQTIAQKLCRVIAGPPVFLAAMRRDG